MMTDILPEIDFVGMPTTNPINAVLPKGGIDLTPANMNLQTKMDSPLQLRFAKQSGRGGNDSGRVGDDSSGIKFHIDPAMLQQLQNAPGFVPVIINIQPMNDLRQFLTGQ